MRVAYYEPQTLWTPLGILLSNTNNAQPLLKNLTTHDAIPFHYSP